MARDSKSGDKDNALLLQISQVETPEGVVLRNASGLSSLSAN